MENVHPSLAPSPAEAVESEMEEVLRRRRVVYREAQRSRGMEAIREHGSLTREQTNVMRREKRNLGREENRQVMSAPLSRKEK